MNKFCIKQKRLLCFLVLFSLLFVLPTYAENDEGVKAQSNVIIGPSSSEPDSVFIDDENYALESLKKVMTTHDLMLAMVYVSDYRKGDKSAAESLTELVAKYNVDNAFQIVNYLLNDNKVRLLATYKIDHATNQLAFEPVKGLTSTVDSNTNITAYYMWQMIAAFIPAEFANNINRLHVELNKDDNNLATICACDEEAKTFDLYVDIRLMDTNKTDRLYENMIYATTYYYCLRYDQIDFLQKNKGTYTYLNHSYKEDSYINTFYKRFWKGRRKEVNTDQYEMYKNEFFNSKASRTVYDDMAVSFYNYVNNGVMRRYLGFKADKNNFFHNYTLFKDLAKQFRVKLNIYIS